MQGPGLSRIWNRAQPLVIDPQTTLRRASYSRERLQEFLADVQASQMDPLHLPFRALLDVFLVIVPPAFEITGRQHHVIEHRPDTASRGGAGQLEFRHKALMN